MSGRKATKRALLTSVMALVMCVVMLVGTTFAWFTDTAKTSVNTIQAGNLKIALVDGDGNDLTQNGEKIQWKVKNQGNQVGEDGKRYHLESDVLWEPGCKFNSEYFYIKNEGNLAVKYKLNISFTGGDTKLLEALEFGGSSNANALGTKTFQSLEELNSYEGYLQPKGQEDCVCFNINVAMKKEAGNEYQGLTLGDIRIDVVATQYTYEYDSTGKEYDAGAEYPVSTSATLLDALKQGGDITVTEDITMAADAGTVTIPSGTTVNLDLGGNTITTNGINQLFLANSCTVKISNGTFVNSNEGRVGTVSGRLGENLNQFGEKVYVTFENVTFKNDNAGADRGNRQIHVLENSEVKFINCTFDTYDSNGNPNRAVDVWNGARDAKVIFCEGTRSTWDYVNWYASEDWHWTPHKMVLEDGCEWTTQTDESGKTWFVVTRTTTG